MLSSLTPFGEASRGHRYAVASSTFIASAIAGGLCLGLLLAGPALAIKSIGVGPTSASAIITVAAALTIAADRGLIKTPRIPRQVNESWFVQFRPWVYGTGYGWQIGVGLVTYVMTNAVYLMLVLAAMSADPRVAIGIGGLFGAVRGFTLLVGWRLVEPARIRHLHRLLDELEPASRAVAISGQSLVLTLAAALWASAWSGPAAVAVLALSIVLPAALVAHRMLRRTATRAGQRRTGSPADARWRSTRSASSSTTSAAVASPQVRSQFASMR
jgi:hypothetical protein